MNFRDANIETLKAKITKLETDLRKSRSDVKNKEDYALKLESKLKEVNNQKSQAQKFADDVSLPFFSKTTFFLLMMNHIKSIHAFLGFINGKSIAT